MCSSRPNVRVTNHHILQVYLSGNAIVILDQPNHIFQTIYHDEVQAFDAVSIDELTGKIAACTTAACYVYQPYGQDEGVLKVRFLSLKKHPPKGSQWSLQRAISPLHDPEVAKTLSWSISEEVLVGSAHLDLYQTQDNDRLIWSRPVSSPVVRAEFSGDAALLATCSQYDCLVKVWRRLSFGSDDVEFDYGYLPHPTAVTGLQWRETKEKDHDAPHVLYTICVDGKIRIWTSAVPHGKQVLRLWREIDMQASIQPRSIGQGNASSDRFALFMSSKDFNEGIVNALASVKSLTDRPFLEHLLEVTARSPEVCLVMDDAGHMSAWTLQGIGSLDPQETDVANLALVEDFKLNWFPTVSGSIDLLSITGFLSGQQDSSFSLLIHERGGSITWLEGRLEDFFDPSPTHSRLDKLASWTGHEAAIKKIVRTMGGRAIFSRTNDNEGYLWKQAEDSVGHHLLQRTQLKSHEHIHRTCVLASGAYVANLHHDSISLWDTQGGIGKQTASCRFNIEGLPLCLLQLPRPKIASNTRYLATISSEMKGIVWKANMRAAHNKVSTDAQNGLLAEYCTFDLGAQKDLAFVLPIDPAGSKPMVSEFLDTFAKDVALSYNKDGVLSTWTAKLNIGAESVDWLCTATVHTGVSEPSLASGSSIRKIALVNKTREVLTIWDTVGGQLEHEKQFEPGDTIQDLDWTSTPDDQSILAVGFPHRVTILAQMRYDYLDRGPAWIPIRSISIRDSTPHPIGDSVWLGNGNIVVGAGNQLFMFDKLISNRKDNMITELTVPIHTRATPNLFDIVSLLNGPLAIFHPQLLSQCILAGKLSLVGDIVVHLGKILNFWSDGDDLDSTLGMETEKIFMEPEVSHKPARRAR